MTFGNGSREEEERRETIEELSDLLLVVQEMGRRLADETHGDAYYPVMEFNELLHQANVQLAAIKRGPGADGYRGAHQPRVVR